MATPGVYPLGDADQDDGSYLELISQSLSGHKKGIASIFDTNWEELERTLPDLTTFFQRYLRVGVEYVMDRIEFLPILPIEAEEKGLKTRYPTCSLTAANLVQQILRRVLDHVMIRDPRCSVALGSETGINLKGEVGPWDSLDATVATDKHAQWLTQTVYEELVDYDPRLKPYQKWVNKLFGPKKLLRCGQLDLIPEDLLAKYPAAPLLTDFGIYTNKRPELERLGGGHADMIITSWDDYIDDLNGLPGVITTTGQMMGDPTSFPPLMLVSIFAGELALQDFPYSKEERVIRHPHLRKGDLVAELVGDDCAAPRMKRERREAFHRHHGSLGTQISEKKTFFHPTRGLIAEQPMEHGRKLPYYPLPELIAPPGGSKGSVTWNTQPRALQGNARIVRYVVKRGMLRKSPYWYTWQYAYKLGLPLAAPEGHGGIELKAVFPKVSTTHHVEWLRYLSSLPLDELIAGTALSIGRSPTSLMAGATKDWLTQVIRNHKDLEAIGGLLSPQPYSDTGELRKSLRDAYREALSSVRSAEFYFRTPPEILQDSTPSVVTAGAKFQRKVAATPWFDKPGVWSYQATNRDLEEKVSYFFTRGGSFLPDRSKPRTFFGLEQTDVVRERYKAPHLTGLG